MAIVISAAVRITFIDSLSLRDVRLFRVEKHCSYDKLFFVHNESCDFVI